MPSLFRRIFPPRRPDQSQDDGDDTPPSQQPSSGRVTASDDQWLTTLGRFDNQVVTVCEAVPRLQVQQLNTGRMSGPWYVADASEIAATGVAPDSDARALARAAENVGRSTRVGATANSDRRHPLGGITVTTTTIIERFNAITGSPVSSPGTTDGGDSPTFPAPAFRTWNPMTRSLAGSRGSFRLGGEDGDSHSHTSSLSTHESERQSFESFVQHLHGLQTPDDHRPVSTTDHMSMAPSDVSHHGDTTHTSDDLDHDGGIARTSDDLGHHDPTCLVPNSPSDFEHQQELDQTSANVDHRASVDNDMTLEEAVRHIELAQSSDHGNNPISSIPSLHYPTPGSQMIHLELRSHCEAVIRALEAIRESATGIIDSDDPLNGRHGGPHYGFRYELAPYYRWAMSRIATEAELSLSVFDAQIRNSRVRDAQALGEDTEDITDGDEDQEKHEGGSDAHQAHSKTM